MCLNVITASYILQFFTTEPYACDPSSLPKYPPSKEMDAKRRDDEMRRYFFSLRFLSAKWNYLLIWKIQKKSDSKSKWKEDKSYED